MEQTLSALGAAILGVVEGVTEFIPVSSTGHLILASHLLGYSGERVEIFEVVIQVGAILAVCGLYFDRLWKALTGLGGDPAARHFAITVIAAFLPAAFLGVIFHSTIKMLFSPLVVAISLIVGGIAILAIERLKPVARYPDAQALPLKVAIGVGLFQCLSLIPGVSRAGASIMGAVLLKVDRKSAAEFSFFLAIPTIIGAAVYEGWKGRDVLTSADLTAIVIGFVVALVSAVIVIKAFIGYLQRHDFTLFGWYRIVAGIVMLIVLGAGG